MEPTKSSVALNNEGKSETEKRFNANKNSFFRCVSWLMCYLSTKVVNIDAENHRGNSLLVFRK